MEGIRVGTKEAIAVGNAQNYSELLLCVSNFHTIITKDFINVCSFAQSYLVNVELVCQ